MDEVRNAKVTIQLPAVITGCDEYETLTEEERTAFLRRLEDALALGASLVSGDRRNGYPDFFRFVENLELDVSHLQEFALPSGGTLSRWLVHYSWTFYTTPADMKANLAPLILNLIDADEPSTDPLELDFMTGCRCCATSDLNQPSTLTGAGPLRQTYVLPRKRH